MAGRTIAIGDIHGCDTALAALIEAIQPTPSDTIVTLGDYVDRGPASREVIDRLIVLGERCQLVTLIGNHETMMLDALEDVSMLREWVRCGGRETVLSYGGTLDAIPQSHVAFLQRLVDFHESADALFVHANYYYDMDFGEQPRYQTLWQHMQPGWEPRPHISGKTVFVGHTPQPSGEVLDLGHVVCIDTACALGGWLTAIDVKSRRIWQADRDGRMREP